MRRFPGKINKLREGLASNIALNVGLSTILGGGRDGAVGGATDAVASDVNSKMYGTGTKAAGSFLGGTRAKRAALRRRGYGRSGQKLPAQDIEKQALEEYNKQKHDMNESSATSRTKWAQLLEGIRDDINAVKLTARAARAAKAAKLAAEAKKAGAAAKGAETVGAAAKADNVVKPPDKIASATQRAKNIQNTTLRRGVQAKVEGHLNDLPQGVATAIKDTANEHIGKDGVQGAVSKVGDAVEQNIKGKTGRRLARTIKKAGAPAAAGVNRALNPLVTPTTVKDASGNVVRHSKGGQTASERMDSIKANKQKNIYNKAGMGGMAGFGVGSLVAAGYARDMVRDTSNAANYQSQQQGISMVQSLRRRPGNLMENKQTWITRKRLYGASGRRSRAWRYDPSNKHHLRHTKGMNDEQFRKYVHSTANLDIRKDAKTKAGEPLNYTYFSNNRKHTYGSKTIGMRQKVISDHVKYRKELPKGFENEPYSNVNGKFKKMMRWGWEKRMFKKAPLGLKIQIKGKDLLKRIKQLMLGKNFNSPVSEESAAETGNISESYESFAPIPDPLMEKECLFMVGTVKTPAKCDCDDCLGVCRRIVESQKEMRETSETSFGQNLRGEEGDEFNSGEKETSEPKNKKTDLKKVKKVLKHKKSLVHQR